MSNTRRFLIVVAVVMAVIAAAAVSAVRAQAPPADALFIRASVDNDRPYLGQQVTYSLRIYQRRDADLSSVRVRYSPPSFAGFWNSQQTRQEEYDETVGGTGYQVVEVRTVLFASVVGATEIEPAVLEISSGASGSSGRLESPAVPVQVRSLSVPEPAGFTGAVGRLKVSASVDSEIGALNEPVLLTVTISGEGNIEALPDPDWPDFSGWRVVESPVSVESQVVAGQLAGNRTYEIALMPEQDGNLSIPGIGYPYFDPTLEQYVELETSPIPVTIGDAGGAPAAPSLPVAADAVEETQALRPIKAVPPSLRRGGTELANSTIYWSVWALPALVIAGAVAWRRWRVSQEAARGEARRNNALPDSRAALSRAAASGQDSRVAASEAVLSYLSARLETDLNGQTREALLRTLRDAGVPRELEDRVSEMLTAGESARYTPDAVGTAGTGNYVDDCSQLLAELEEAISA